MLLDVVLDDRYRYRYIIYKKGCVFFYKLSLIVFAYGLNFVKTILKHNVKNNVKNNT